MNTPTRRSRSSESLVARIRAEIAAEAAARGPSARLPRVRDLMRRHATSQRVVARALAPLIAEGIVVARPGAGLRTPPRAPEATANEAREADCVILYRSSESRLARNLLHELGTRLLRSGLRVERIGFSDEAQAMHRLAGRGRFRCALLQCNFEIVSVAFLAAIRDHADALVIDGVSVTGIDADVIGTNWREALSIGYRALRARGHRRIGFLTSSHEARQIAMARREFHLLAGWQGPGAHPHLFQVDRLPGDYRREDILTALPERGGDAITALIVWGLVDGYLLDGALHAKGLRPGIDFSVMLLGSVDFRSEHVALFDTVGNSNAEKLALFEAVVRALVAGGGAPPRTHYLPVHLAEMGSVVGLGDG